MNLLLYPLVLPFLIGIVCLTLPQRLKAAVKGLALIGSLITFLLTIWLFTHNPSPNTFYLRIGSLSKFILVFIGLFGFLITLYSVKSLEDKEQVGEYYGYILWTIGVACGVLMANNLILLLVFWGFLGLTLYLLIGIGGPEASAASKKTFIIVGGSDCLMILGVGIIYFLTNTFQMDEIQLPIANHPLPTVAFLCLGVAAFAKAGAMPLHSWIPDCAQKAPVPVTAFLPASLDKLLGIYLLARITMDLFVLDKAMGMVLLIVGAFTIVAAVMMALVQHDFKRLLGYDAVSQVGYMVLGIGTGNPVGIAGGLFHMLNSAVYESCLFLCGGAVEKRTGTSDLDKLGGLARFMPITFVTCLIAALSISGVPPFNGFVSKWMVYQGVIELGKQGDKLWIIWLVAAMFGSALTLASFMKLIHAVFLGSPADSDRSKTKEVSAWMWLPMLVLAAFCVVFGIFAYAFPLKKLILPAVPGVSFVGFWSPGLATILLIVGVVIGVVIYLVGNIKGEREDISFVGGEVIQPEMRVSGVDFYRTVEDFRCFKTFYRGAERKLFDIYDLSRAILLILLHRSQEKSSESKRSLGARNKR